VKFKDQKIIFVEEWDYDFNLFKYQCKSSRPEIQIGVNEEKKLENEFKEKSC